MTCIQAYVPDEAAYGRLFHLLDRLGLGDRVGMHAQLSGLDRTRPWYVCVPVRGFAELGDAGLLTPRIAALIADPQARLLLDFSIEALTFEGYGEAQLLALHRHLQRQGIAADRVTLLNANVRSAEGYTAWAQGIGGRMQVRGYPFYLFEYHWELRLSAVMRKRAKALRRAARRDAARPYHYLSLNLRPRPHRMALLLHLLDRGLLAKGQASYFGDSFADAPTVATAEETRAFVAALPSGARLLAQWEALRAMSPLTFERDGARMRKDLWQRLPGEVSFLIPEAERRRIRFSHYLEIVTETWLSDAGISYVTEKTLRPMLRLQPFIHLGSPGMLAELQELGFATFSPLIDEGYDAIAEPGARLEAALAEIDRLCALPLARMREVYAQLWPRLEHNFRHLLRLEDVARAQLEALLAQLGGGGFALPAERAAFRADAVKLFRI